MAAPVPTTRAQTPDSTRQARADWTLVADGNPVPWTPPRARTLSLDSLAARALRYLQRDGYYLARIDSALVDEGEGVLYASRGPQVEVGRLDLDGLTALDVAQVRADFTTRSGQVFDAARLERDLDGLLAAYERAGYPLAQARVETTLDADSTGQLALRVAVQVDEGRTLRLAAVEAVSRDTSAARARTSGRFAARIADLRTDAPLVAYDPAAIRERLEATDLYEAVGTPYLVLADPSAPDAATLRIPVEERPPGTFDLILGYLPPTRPGTSGQVVGNGLLQLVNVFGGGRLFSLRLVRNPGLVSSVDLRAADPFVAGLPLRIEASFEGRGQDSTFAQQRYGLEVGYQLAPGLSVFGAFTRENTDPGPAGRRLGSDGLPLVPAADATFAGIGLRYRRIDRAVNPRRGLVVEAIIEQGRKTRRFPGAADSVAQAFATSLPQQRLVADARVFVPTFARQVFVTGGDVAVLLSDVYDTAELFRYGGARSLRGYDEERFLGNVVARAVFEYRYQLDRTSFAFVFADVGYVATPEIVGRPTVTDPTTEARIEAQRGIEPGFGFGLQQRTPLGLLTFSYALNPEDGATQGKVHAGLVVGL
ncbi:MAG: BamA/TamA family outer membrane protein [Bacteroidota bacterium]